MISARRMLALLAFQVAFQAAGLLAIAHWIAPPAQAATPRAAWKLALTPMPANFAPGASPEFFLVATNVGAAPTSSEPTTVEVTLPPGLNPTAFKATNEDPSAKASPGCKIEAPSVICTTTEPLRPGRMLRIKITVEVTVAKGSLVAEASVKGGGANQEVKASVATPISALPVPFDFLPGFGATLTDEDGQATTQAGAHPYQLTVDVKFPTEKLGAELTNAGHPRDVRTDLPRGLIGDPAAAPVLCTEAELASMEQPGCPEESQVGTVDVTTLIAGPGTNGVENNNLYAMVPPPGSPAAFGFDVLGIGVFVHLIAGVRSDGDYGAYATSNDILALGSHPVFNLQAQLWGDPSGKAHDAIRGKCEKNGVKFNEKTSAPEPCSVDPQDTAFWTMPGDCPGNPLRYEAHADSWEEPGIVRETSYESADLAGNPISVEGCNAVKFEPETKIEARPTTNLTDSPSGLDFHLHQPQNFDLEGQATASLKDASVVFPAGMAVNASQASGLGACTTSQIGLTTPIGQMPIHFSKAPNACPDASKIGTVEVTTPLLVQRDATTHEIARNPETKEALQEPLHGSVYIAKPFENPFNSLIAVYFAVEDPKNGIVAKLAGKGELDPATGQISTRFEENPELPLEDIRVHLFGGAKGALITPPTCTPQTTSADLTPWSAPEAPNAQLSDSFTPSATPIGGNCPTAESQLPVSPGFSAGTISPQAGKYSPLLFKLSREDGTQRLAKLETTLPPGLSARLAGVAQCSDAQIAKAISREHPSQGVLEQADPSCPAASEVGVVTVGAGAGPTPYYTQGRAYLAGPYKGGPLSLVIITPAVAGPFDLGAVAVRTALYIDSTTAQVRAVSDPLPSIIDGIPLDVRSVAVKMVRQTFTLNPTSCNPKAFAGAFTSTLGQIAPLAERFQVGGCKALAFKPKLTTRLFGPIHRGGHPRFRVVFAAKPGEANTKRIVLALPHSEFIDQAHFRTICTRVQFAANQCPAGSIYGHVKATTPLLDYPLEGPIYLRSSSNELPDAVAALRGPPSQPVEFDGVARIDSVNGGLRATIPIVPDAPLTKVVITQQGGKKGLFQNSTNICKGTHRATVKLDGQNGKTYDTRPLMKADCPKPRKKKGGK